MKELNFDWFRDLLKKSFQSMARADNMPKSIIEEQPERLFHFTCGDCGHNFRAVGRSVLQGTAGCPACVRGILRHEN